MSGSAPSRGRTEEGQTFTAGTATGRRELGVLQAALDHAHAEGVLVHPLKVTLSEPSLPRDRWLTRSEVARLLKAASPHTRRFILISAYTGRRMSAALELNWARVDLDAGVIRFRRDGERETKKRRGRVRMPRQLAAHLRRWKAAARLGETHVNSFRGEPIDSIKTAIRRAGLASPRRQPAHARTHRDHVGDDARPRDQGGG
jgi:integrase